MRIRPVSEYIHLKYTTWIGDLTTNDLLSLGLKKENLQWQHQSLLDSKVSQYEQQIVMIFSIPSNEWFRQRMDHRVF